MNDAIALLAISQLVCLGALFYLYTQLQEYRKAGRPRRQPSTRVHRMPGSTEVGSRATARAAHVAYAGPVSRPRPALPTDIASLVARSRTGVDVTALARRMRKSEEEVRLLLRRQGIAS